MAEERLESGRTAYDIVVMISLINRDIHRRALELAAEVSFEQGVTAVRVSDEKIRATLVRLGVKWKRAKEWIHSPDPEYVRKKRDATG